MIISGLRRRPEGFPCGAWEPEAELAVHGWIYRVSDGILKDLNVCTTGIHEIPEIQRIV